MWECHFGDAINAFQFKKRTPGGALCGEMKEYSIWGIWGMQIIQTYAEALFAYPEVFKLGYANNAPIICIPHVLLSGWIPRVYQLGYANNAFLL